MILLPVYAVTTAAILSRTALHVLVVPRSKGVERRLNKVYQILEDHKPAPMRRSVIVPSTMF